MEIQLMMPSPAVDFNFQSTTTTPYATTLSTPQRFPNFFYTTPTIPMQPTVRKFQAEEDGKDTDFAFDFTGQPEPPYISAADELFHGGKIKPLKPVSYSPPKSPAWFREAFPPRCKKKDFGTFTEAFNQTSGDQTQSNIGTKRTTTMSTTRDKVKVSRSPSTFRTSDVFSDEVNNQKNALTWYSRWNLKNLLLFRSASEGSGSARRHKDPVNKYSRIMKCEEDVKHSSFRSMDGCRSVGGSSRRVVRKVSAHEIHYTVNRAVAEEMKKKTFLPYKSGLLGCLGFHNNGGGSVHEISRGVSSVMKHRRG